jgi:hypothetical protein
MERGGVEKGGVKKGGVVWRRKEEKQKLQQVLRRGTLALRDKDCNSGPGDPYMRFIGRSLAHHPAGNSFIAHAEAGENPAVIICFYC